MHILDAINTKKEKKIFFCHTMYHIFVALSIILANCSYQACTIVVAPMRHPKDNIEFYIDIVNRIKQAGINTVLIDKGGFCKRLFGISEIKNRRIFRTVLQDLDCQQNEYLMINMSWNKQVVVYPASIFFKHCKNAIFVEEGAQLWLTPKENVLYTLCLGLYGNQLNWWKSNKIEYVFAHSKEKLIELGVPKSKAQIFSLQQIIQTYDDLKKKYLCSFFVNEVVLKKLMECNDSRKCIVYTQPISEDGYVSEKEKVRLYSEICNFYSRYGNVFLKVHPRDVTDYSIENVIVIRDRFPSEIFKILEIHFFIAVGLCTSAIDETIANHRKNIAPTYLSDR
ncbi:glycosyltransferase family 52 [Kandleria sp.]|uniref:glycosyltransferase family 52 n=1 Tax=Kandleria sp. TaxID=2774291 RepID=UPI001B632051|nr:glycosyltransferase family 52 [Kandleria sp.]MBP3275668.1 hypothetical protein [Kandleria sp.]